MSFSNSKNSSQKLASIQILRGIAASFIVVYHLLNMSTLEDSLLLGFFNLKSFLTIGVPIFFVISGFIILITTYNGQTARLSPKRFILKRMTRIYPLYWFVFIVAFLIHLSPITKPTPLATDYMVKSFFLFPTFDANGKFYPFVYVGWTLVFEMYFYLLFAFLMKLRLNNMLPVLTVFMLGSVGLGFVAETSSAWLHLVTHTYILLFLAGCITGWFYLHDYRIRPAIFYACMVMILVSGLLLVFDITTVANVGLSPLLQAIFAIGLVAAFALQDHVVNAHKRKLLMTMGDASYSTYLTHSYLIMLATGLWKRDIIFPMFNEDVVIVVMFIGCSIAGYLCYRLVEAPMLRYGRKIIKKT